MAPLRFRVGNAYSCLCSVMAPKGAMKAVRKVAMNTKSVRNSAAPPSMKSKSGQKSPSTHGSQESNEEPSTAAQAGKAQSATAQWVKDELRRLDRQRGDKMHVAHYENLQMAQRKALGLQLRMDKDAYMADMSVYEIESRLDRKTESEVDGWMTPWEIATLDHIPSSIESPRCWPWWLSVQQDVLADRTRTLLGQSEASSRSIGGRVNTFALTANEAKALVGIVQVQFDRRSRMLR